MGRIMNEDEFKASMRFAAAEEEVTQSEKAEEPEEKPTRKRPGPKPGSKRKRSVSTTSKQSKAAGGKRKTEEQGDNNIQVIDETKSKANKQSEALRALIALTEAYTQHLINESGRALNTADKLADMAQIYTGYIETVEEVIG